MGRMAEITLGAGDAATAPWWAKHPENETCEDAELFIFKARIGCGSKEVEVVAKCFSNGYCEEIVAVLARGVEDIADYLTSEQLDDLCKLAETKYHAEN